MRLEIQFAALVKLEELYRRDRSDLEFQVWLMGILLTAILAIVLWMGFGRVEEIKSAIHEGDRHSKKRFPGFGASA